MFNLGARFRKRIGNVLHYKTNDICIHPPNLRVLSILQKIKMEGGTKLDLTAYEKMLHSLILSTRHDL